MRSALNQATEKTGERKLGYMKNHRLHIDGCRLLRETGIIATLCYE